MPFRLLEVILVCEQFLWTREHFSSYTIET